MPAHLLLADDELHILKAAEFKFNRQGYRVDCARDGQEAWDKVQADPPDMLVTDLQMPRMNGLQLIQRLRDDPRFRDLPAILLTAKGFELDHDDIISRLGVFEIVSKPFSPRDLCKRVEMALAESAGRRRPAEAPAAAPHLDFVAGAGDVPRATVIAEPAQGAAS